MNKRILLGVDASISAGTQHALHTIAELIEQTSPLFRLVLLNVIPVPYVASPSLNMYAGQIQPSLVTLEQRAEAENALRKVSTALQHRGIGLDEIEMMIRIGIPADEIARAAKELQVDYIVIGSRGNSFGQKLRRFFLGSTSRKVLHLAPCPVMIVAPPVPVQTSQPSDLVTWYEEAITNYLQDHTGDLTVFTPHEVALMFAPVKKKAPGRKEKAAAVLALEHLARNGVLCRHDVRGEMRYVND